MQWIDQALPEGLLLRAMSEFEAGSFERYTEHPGRYGARIRDPELLAFLDGEMKERVARALGEPSASLVLSAVWACADGEDFEMPFHVDDVYKRISCVLYMGDGFQGTSYVDMSRGELVVPPRTNRLLFFRSRKVLHRVKRNIFRRFTVQFHYHDGEPRLDDP